uniref:E3 ubiquitin-protein ligase RNF26 n=1 Tax=Mola mola TaxID=94237 RepID=A0A3Q4BBH1_MOLML
MGLVDLVISSVGKSLDAVCLLLDLNFLIVHTVVQTVLAVVTIITCLPTVFLNSLVELGNFIVSGMVSLIEAASDVAHGTVTVLGSTWLGVEGLLESLKMVRYLFMHVLLCGKEHLCRGLLVVLEGCSIAVSLVVYFVNTVINFALIATQNVYVAMVSVLQTVSSPLQKVLELTLTSLTFLYGSLVGILAFLWSPCKLVLDFVVSLLQMFVSIFILNINGLMLTFTIALTTTALLNPDLTRNGAVVPRLAGGAVQHLPRLLHHLYLLERGLWQQLSRLSSQLGLALRTHLHRDSRVRGDGDLREQRWDPLDGIAGDEAHEEVLDVVFPSSSTDRPLKKQLSSGKDTKALPAENLLTLLKEQEERKRCVICQDCNKTVVLLPCRHLCLCRNCTSILLRQPIYQQNCPLCRHMILSTMDVYL